MTDKEMERAWEDIEPEKTSDLKERKDYMMRLLMEQKDNLTPLAFGGTTSLLQDYEHALAAKDKEIEALRGEVERLTAIKSELMDQEFVDEFRELFTDYKRLKYAIDSEDIGSAREEALRFIEATND